MDDFFIQIIYQRDLPYAQSNTISMIRRKPILGANILGEFSLMDNPHTEWPLVVFFTRDSWKGQIQGFIVLKLYMVREYNIKFLKMHFLLEEEKKQKIFLLYAKFLILFFINARFHSGRKMYVHNNSISPVFQFYLPINLFWFPKIIPSSFWLKEWWHHCIHLGNELLSYAFSMPWGMYFKTL